MIIDWGVGGGGFRDGEGFTWFPEGTEGWTSRRQQSIEGGYRNRPPITCQRKRIMRILQRLMGRTGILFLPPPPPTPRRLLITDL